MKKKTKTSFFEDIKGHKMKVVRDDGIYRHLHFAAEGEHSWNQWFDIMTWPGYLAITGDMGDWMFSRTEDMFTFFRRPDGGINPHYWREKIKARSVFGGPEKEFSFDLFKQEVTSHYKSAMEWGDYDGKKTKIWEEIKNELFHIDPPTEDYCRIKLNEFESYGFRFQDTFEWDMTDYTEHYIWCLHAIVWAIEQYDAAHQKKEAA